MLKWTIIRFMINRKAVQSEKETEAETADQMLGLCD